jgi:hypothetical protein
MSDKPSITGRLPRYKITLLVELDEDHDEAMNLEISNYGYIEAGLDGFERDAYAEIIEREIEEVVLTTNPSIFDKVEKLIETRRDELVKSEGWSLYEAWRIAIQEVRRAASNSQALLPEDEGGLA